MTVNLRRSKCNHIRGSLPTDHDKIMPDYTSKQSHPVHVTQSFGRDLCASLTEQLLFSTVVKRAPTVDVLWNYAQLVNSGPVSYFPTLTNTARCFPGSISYCATIKTIKYLFIPI